jgi:hypothetical protein
VWLGRWVEWLLTPRRTGEFNFNDIAFDDIVWVHTAMVGTPFLLLALYSSGAPRPGPTPGNASPGSGRAAILGVLVTCLVWGYYYYDGYAYQRDQRTTGADFGVAFLVLGSPLIVACAMIIGVASARLGRRPRGGR